MRLRFSLCAPVAAGLLASACTPDSDPGPNPYVNLVGSSRYVSANRLSTTAGDTLTTSGCVLGGLICRTVKWARSN